MDPGSIGTVGGAVKGSGAPTTRPRARPGARPHPRATYRLQLHKDFGFAAAAALAPYLAQLGVSHVYLSPILKARRGSTHGYDIVDHAQLNPELGTMEDFRDLAGAMREAGLGIILDIVPNHMGIGGDENAQWLDVLEWGPRSRYADWFDIDWNPPDPTLTNTVLVPLLGKSYADSLKAGELALRFNPRAGSFALWAPGEHKLPLNPLTYAEILASSAAEPLADLAPRFAALLPGDERAASALKRRLADAAAEPAHREALSAAVARLMAPGAIATLDALIRRQHWRLAEFTVAADDINYRRFFIVSDLAGLRVENPEVFDAVHHLVFSLIGEGLVEGLRIDHIDGLYDPKAYCLKLRAAAGRPIYLVVEKILARDEELPLDWGVEGTTGYEFGATLTQLLTDPRAEGPLTRTYRDFSAQRQSLAEIIRDGKSEIVDFEMAAELDALATRLRAVAADNIETVDITRNTLRAALRAFVSELGVYRAYPDESGVSAQDRAQIEAAIAAAELRALRMDEATMACLRRILLVDPADPLVTEAARDCARRIQQYCGPVMAKGLEDTALYRYNRLLALNEVGLVPDRFGLPIEAFHRFNTRRAQTVPAGMLATSTHDTKRGEDGRARLAALCDCAEPWGEAVAAWRARLEAAGAPPIDPNTLYYLFQQLIAAWPPELMGGEGDHVLFTFRDRVQGALRKAVREARAHTSWTRPNADYESALARNIDICLLAAPDLRGTLGAFAERVGRAGAEKSLVATALKLSAPGVPDLYQGTELWDTSMVDPDNRRPVDFALRQAMLAQFGDTDDLAALLPHWPDGRVKFAVTTRLLALRRAEPDLFARGQYEPAAIEERASARIVAFWRRLGPRALLVAARLDTGGPASAGRITLPDLAPDAAWRDLVGGGPAADPGLGRTLDLAGALARFPVAVLFADAVAAA